MRFNIFVLVFICFGVSIQEISTDNILNVKSRYIASTNESKSCMSFLKSILTFGMKVEDFNWEDGRVLSQAQLDHLIKFSKNSSRSLQKGDSIRVWTKEMLQPGAQVGSGSQYQIIKYSEEYEESLIGLSQIDSSPREVLQIRLHYHSGQVKALDHVFGKAFEVNFDKAIDGLRDYTGGNLAGISVIEISHTHPGFALSVIDEFGRRYARANELSQGDFEALRMFYNMMPNNTQVLLKAIVPNGFYYVTGFQK